MGEAETNSERRLMKYYAMLYIAQLIVVGMATNIRPDTTWTEKFLSCLLIATIIPISVFLTDKEEENKMKRKEGYDE